MSMEHKAGTELLTGVTDAVSGTGLEQTVTKSPKGEFKVFKDKAGKEISLYVTGKHHEYSFEALLAAAAEEKEIGDGITIGSKNYYVQSWDVVEKNDDAQLVRGTVRDFPDITSGGSQQGGNPPGGGEAS